MLQTRICCGLLLSASLLAQTPNLDWQLEANPPSRSSFALQHHDAIGKTVLFGGLEGGYFDDTWTWDGEWQRVASSLSPAPRSRGAMAYDSTRGRLILFGGRDRLNVMGDTWSFDGSQWTQLAPLASPPPTYQHKMCYDPGRDRIILKGGNLSLLGSSTTALWEFDGITWQLIPQGATAPSTGSMVYDAARTEVLLWTALTLHAWDGSSWSQRSGVGLPAPSSVQMQYDPVTQRVLVANPYVGGAHQAGTYAYDGQGWVQQAATSPGSSVRRTMAFDSVRQRWLALQNSAFSNAESQSHTWVLSGGQWQRVLVGLPAARRNAAMAYDTLRRRMVLHGGDARSSDRNDLFEADHRNWTRVVGPSASNADRQLLSMVFDENRNETLVFGGTFPPSSVLLAWTNAGWSFGNPTTSPPGRWRNAMAYDSLRRRTLVYGGESTVPVLGDMWSWDGSDWTQVAASGPGARRDVAMSYDRDRDRIVLFGGHNGSTYLDDTWEFDGFTWLLRTPVASPSVRARHVQVYDTHLQRTVLYGGTDDTDLRDTWLWDGSTWTELTTATRPDTGTGVCAAYDRDRQELILFGGGDTLFEGSRGEVWRLRNLNLGVWQTSGMGCDTGQGLLELSALDPPSIGSTSRLRLNNTLPSFVALPIAWVGFDNQQWNGVALPVSLAALGAPGCFVWADAQIALPLLALGTVAHGNLVLPDVPSAVGLQLYVQGASWDFATGTVVTANLLTATVGLP